MISSAARGTAPAPGEHAEGSNFAADDEGSRVRGAIAPPLEKVIPGAGVLSSSATAPNPPKTFSGAKPGEAYLVSESADVADAIDRPIIDRPTLCQT